VLDDVKNRYVTIEKAKEDYKVSITSDLKIDQNSTDKLRKN
jgi:N-methylhydantoinase B/oxoprolinase/acetone carboxylase alpha subunit